MSSAEDAIENIIGRFGKYQTCIYLLVALGRLPSEFQLTNVVFIVPSVDYVCEDENAYNLTNHCPCQNPQYNQSIFSSSVTSSWNLICDQRHLTSWTQSIFHIGILIGSLFYGYVSDRFGRKMACQLALLLQVIFVASSSAVSKLWMFMVLRFLIGTAVGGAMLCCYVLIIEISGKSFRPYLTGLIEASYVFGSITLPMIAYFVRDWRHLQLATSLPWFFVLFYYFIIPESPRWLITMKRKKVAIATLTKIAKRNNRPTENIEAVVEKLTEEIHIENQMQYGSFIDLFKTAKVRAYTLIMANVWLCCSLTYFGVNQYIGLLQGNIYLNVMLSALSLVPAIISVVFASLYLKRRLAVIVSFAIAGISLLVLLIIPSNRVMELILIIITYSSLEAAFVQIYLYCSEVFPTVVRNSALGFASAFARVGGFIAPFVVNIGIRWVSLVIFSCLSFCAAFSCYFLPETKDTVLLNTIDQTENKEAVNES